MEVDPELVVPDPALSLAEGALAPWSSAHISDYFGRLVEALAETIGFRIDMPWRKLPAKAQQGAARRPPRPGARPLQEPLRPRALLLHELRGRDPVRRAPARRGRDRRQPRAVRGLHARGAVPGLPGRPAQAGRRWPSRSGARSIAEVAALPIGECADFLRELDLDARETQIAERVLKEVNERLRFLLDVGLRLPHASTARPARWPAARPSASGSPPRSAPAWSACSTCSTSRPSGCTSATTTG